MKVAVWGLGGHAIKNILPAFELITNLDLYGVLSRNRNVVEKCKKDFRCISWKNSEEMLQDNELDIVYVSTPPSLHFYEGFKILNAGKHFWCEKPFTTTLEESKRILSLSEDKNLSAYEAFMYLYHPHYQKLKEILQNKLLGKIETIECTFSLPELEKPGYRFNSELGGSALLDVGSYPLSIILNLFPGKKLKIINVDITKDSSTSVDISGQVQLLLGDNTKCFLNWAYNQTYKNEITIKGKQGSLFTDKIFSKDSDYEASLILEDSIQNKLHTTVEPANHFHLMLESFFKAICLKTELDIQRKSILSLAKLIHKVEFFN